MLNSACSTADRWTDRESSGAFFRRVWLASQNLRLHLRCQWDPYHRSIGLCRKQFRRPPSKKKGGKKKRRKEKKRPLVKADGWEKTRGWKHGVGGDPHPPGNQISAGTSSMADEERLFASCTAIRNRSAVRWLTMELTAQW